MHVNLIAAAVPVFFAAIVAETLVDRKKKTGFYRFGSAISDLDAGIASQVADVFLRGIGIWIYAAVYRHRWFDFPEGSVWPWVVGLLGIDFLYYWWHRLSHVVSLLWAVHAVHHQSEDFNLAVALRQPAFEALSIIPFHLPLALLGVDPWIYVSCYAIDLIYQFWVHTEHGGRLGKLEGVLNTPSSHRVHHGINREYLDKNYGGILVIWDRIFGSYRKEEEKAVYGVTHPLGSYNPIWANLAPFHELAWRVRLAARPVDKLRTLFAHPAWRPEIGATGSAGDVLSVTRATQEKYAPLIAPRVAKYVFAHFVLLAAVGGAFMSFAEQASPTGLIMPAAFILASTLVLAGWTERRRWAPAIDAIRQLGAVVLVMVYATPRIGLATSAAAAAILAMVLVAIFASFRPSAPMKTN